MIKSLTLSIGLALTLATPAFGAIEWAFNDGGANPSGSATIYQGSLSTGWHDGGTIPWTLGGAQGFWDLGKVGLGNAGSIVLSGLTSTGPSTLQVFQWVNSGTYNGDITYSLNGGGSSLLTAIGVVQATDHGAWWQYDANLVASLGLGDTVKISSGSGEMGNRRWGIGDGESEMGNRRWELEDGRWECDLQSSIFQLPSTTSEPLTINFQPSTLNLRHGFHG